MRSSSWYAFNVLAYSDKWNCYGSTDKSAGCSVAFFLQFFCVVCERWNNFDNHFSIFFTVMFATGGMISD